MEKHNGKPRYYFGIDLGTTNSVLAWVNIEEQRGGLIAPKVVKLSMPGHIDRIPDPENQWPNIVYEELLPSCVFFPPHGATPVVGPHAKSELRSSQQRVVKSIKTEIGDPSYSEDFDGTTYKAYEISSEILKTLVNGVQAEFPKCELLNEAVICVPASFDPSMCAATEKAAKKAGFKNPILFEEPIAALYDYHNRQERGILLTDAIGIEFNSTEPKLILVFDLGGGTLDVSLHKVTRADRDKLNITDSVVSRYTAIGGDNFDNLLATHFLHRTEAPPNLRPYAREYAEDVKIDLSNKAATISPSHGTSVTATTTISMPILKPGFSLSLSLSEYEKIVSPLLAYSLTLETVNSKNIIYPIIDVLKKWEEIHGSIPTPDAILLNGSMTRFHTIQKRLENFFGDVPISQVGDPEISVARGAVIEHYNRYHP